MANSKRVVRVMFEAQGYTKNKFECKRVVKTIPQDIPMPNGILDRDKIQRALEDWVMKEFIRCQDYRYYFENYGI